MPPEALVPNVVSLPKHRVSASTESSSMAKKVLECHGSETLKMPFLQRSYYNGLFSGAMEAPGPLLVQQFHADLAARLKRECDAET